MQNSLSPMIAEGGAVMDLRYMSDKGLTVQKCTQLKTATTLFE
jgi:hypothetical protein